MSDGVSDLGIADNEEDFIVPSVSLMSGDGYATSVKKILEKQISLCASHGPYYFSASAGKAFRPGIVDAYYKACLYAGFNFSRINGEVKPGQWEFQVNPSVGISSSDEL